ncbi:MAG: hypothetical protein Q8L88_00605 [Bacteroidota bacterium]|nr:hypothetical protein [Bacteroidota bacterium]
MKNPDQMIGILWLRHSSQYTKRFSVVLPIFIHKTAHGEKVIAVDPNEVQKYLKLDQDDVVRLTRRFLYPQPAQSRLQRVLLDRRAMAEQYRELIQSGVVRNQAELSRHLGVSRAWITKVMNTLKIKHFKTE